MFLRLTSTMTSPGLRPDIPATELAATSKITTPERSSGSSNSLRVESLISVNEKPKSKGACWPTSFFGVEFLGLNFSAFSEIEISRFLVFPSRTNFTLTTEPIAESATAFNHHVIGLNSGFCCGTGPFDPCNQRTRRILKSQLSRGHGVHFGKAHANITFANAAHFF